MRVRVLDGGTGRPIEGARVTTMYTRYAGDLFAPGDHEARTGPNGIAEFWVRRWRGGPGFHAAADGYTYFSTFRSYDDAMAQNEMRKAGHWPPSDPRVVYLWTREAWPFGASSRPGGGAASGPVGAVGARGPG